MPTPSSPPRKFFIYKCSPLSLHVFGRNITRIPFINRLFGPNTLRIYYVVFYFVQNCNISAIIYALILTKYWLFQEYIQLTIFREKNQTKKVSEGLECGITLKDFSDFKEKDIIEVYNSVITERRV